MTTSTKSLAIRGVFFNYLGRGCSIFITFFLTPFLITKLGDERYGLWSIVMALTGYYALADLGMRASGTKHIAASHARNNPEKVNQIVVTALVMYAAIAAVLLVVIGIVAWLFPTVFDIPGERTGAMQLVVLLTGLNFAVSLVGQPFGSVLAALARFDISNMIGAASQILAAVCMVLVLTADHGLVGMAVVTLCVGVCTQLSLMLCILRLLPSLSLSTIHFSRSELRELFSFSVGIVTINGLRRITQFTSPIIIGVMIGPASVAIYSIAESIIGKSSGLTKGLSTVVMPITSRLDASGNRIAILQMSIQVNRLMQSASLFMMVVFTVMGERLIDLWIEPGYGHRVYPVLMLLGAANVVTMISGGLPSTLIGMNQLRSLRIVYAVDAVLSLSFGIAFAYMYGIVGMAAAFLLARLVTHAVLLPLVAARQFERPIIEMVLRSNLPAIASAVPAGLLCIALEYNLPATSLWVLVGQVGCVGLVAALSAFFVCVPHSERSGLLVRLKLTRSRVAPLPDAKPEPSTVA